MFAQRRPPISTRDSLTEQRDLFEQAARIAHEHPAVRVCVPVGDHPWETAVLDGRLLSDEGAEVY